VAVPRYTGTFGVRQAERLLWRAGFGPRRGEAAALAELGLGAAVRSLTRPPAAQLEGPAPTDDDGLPLAPGDAWGHDHLWWLDRMVRSNQQLVERMTLAWHDWFATADAPTNLLLDQNRLFRRHALGSFKDLLLDVTIDPAMLLFLSGTSNSKWSPNENYARELMELFTLGAGQGYTEDDVREQARALTGWRNDWIDAGPVNFRFDRNYHDTGTKTVFGRSGAWNWQDACRLCLEHPRHPEYVVGKLWSYFIPTPPPSGTRAELEQLYLDSGYAITPLLEAILKHPDLYAGPRMTKPPVVYIAGMLRALGRGIDTDSWTWIADYCGQLLFRPPNVAGWDEDRWLDTATWRGRWIAANYALDGRTAEPDGYSATEGAEAALRKALRAWGNPTVTGKTRDNLLSFGRECERLADQSWEQDDHRGLRQNALRMLIATSPDLQTC
jgi:uncharacterized protein (DUF1800 family)